MVATNFFGKTALGAVIGLILCVMANSGYAQNKMNQEVKVVKPYEPTIPDADKITELPRIVDTNKVLSQFSYDIQPVRFETNFKPKVIKPAKLVSEPLPKLYTGYARLGFGSYLSPLAEVYLGTKRSENWNVNGMVTHLSSHGKVTNSAGEKVYAGFTRNKLGVESNYLFKTPLTLTTSAKFHNSDNYYYGYNPSAIPSDSTPPLTKSQIEQQTVNAIEVNAALHTNHIDSAHLNYNLELGYNYLTAKNSVNERKVRLNTGFNYFMEKEFLGVDIALDYIANSGLHDTLNGAIVKFSPWVGAYGKKWRVQAGVSTFYNQAKESYYFYPRLSMHYNIIDYFLIPYVELQGNYYQNTYWEIYNQNPFITGDLKVTPTDNRVLLTFGFRGNISSMVAFNAKVDFADVQNQYFFVNDTSLYLQNKFNVVYDDMQRVKLLAEFSYKFQQKLFISIKGQYFIYNMANELKPWHMPAYELSLHTRYKLQDKIVLSFDIFGQGERFAREFDAQNKVVAKQLSGIIDASLGVEYRLTKRFGAFAQFNNLGAVKYYAWNNYPTQRFNAMLGVNYLF